MFLCDLHTHTCFSFDAEPEATPDAMCRHALEIGLNDLAITDHCDINNVVEGIYTPYRADEAYAAVQEVKEKYKGRLNVLCGVELGNPHHYPDVAKEVLAAHPYDFVIGSLHNLRHLPDFCMLRYEMMTPIMIHRYIDQMLDETIEIVSDTDGLTTVGHITYIHRYLTMCGVKIDFKPYYDKIRELYRVLMERDIALELNVSTLWKGLGISLPTLELLKLYHDCGGRLVTIGSDAHSPANLGKCVRKGYALLGAAGFSEVMTVRDGQKVMQSIL